MLSQHLFNLQARKLRNEPSMDFCPSLKTFKVLDRRLTSGLLFAIVSLEDSQSAKVNESLLSPVGAVSQKYLENKSFQ